MDPASLTTSPEPQLTWIADSTSLTFKYDSETVRLEAWGRNALRVRATHEAFFPTEDWALSEPLPAGQSAVINQQDKPFTIQNGNITATVSARGKLTFRNQHNAVILEEYTRHRLDLADPKCSALQISAREFKPRLGTESYELKARFESLDSTERIYGMGQYQQPYLDLKGVDLELAQRNSQASVPFALSSLGYGFLWNNPAIGRAVFGKNMTTFQAASTRVLDYWVVAGDSPADICRSYAKVTGTVPEMPEFGLGFWQCKLRYQTQEELLSIAREHVKERGLPLDVIVVDFFHWPKEGEWKFDPTFWPDPGTWLPLEIIPHADAKLTDRTRCNDCRTEKSRCGAYGFSVANRRPPL
jgi:alpha-D-xyloside xylohydrolase